MDGHLDPLLGLLLVPVLVLGAYPGQPVEYPGRFGAEAPEVDPLELGLQVESGILVLVDPHRTDQHLQPYELGLVEGLGVGGHSSDLTQHIVQLGRLFGQVNVALEAHIGQHIAVKVGPVNDFLFVI